MNVLLGQLHCNFYICGQLFFQNRFDDIGLSMPNLQSRHHISYAQNVEVHNPTTDAAFRKVDPMIP